jgi:hypothetical protein
VHELAVIALLIGFVLFASFGDRVGWMRDARTLVSIGVAIWFAWRSHRSLKQQANVPRCAKHPALRLEYACKVCSAALCGECCREADARAVCATCKTASAT